MGERYSDRIVLTYIEKMKDLFQTESYTADNRLSLLNRYRIEINASISVLVAASLSVPETHASFIEMVVEAIATDFIMVFSPKVLNDRHIADNQDLTRKVMTMLFNDEDTHVLASSGMYSHGIFATFSDNCETAYYAWIETPFAYRNTMDTFSCSLLDICSKIQRGWNDPKSKWMDVDYQNASEEVLTTCANNVNAAYKKGILRLKELATLTEMVKTHVESKMTPEFRKSLKADEKKEGDGEGESDDEGKAAEGGRRRRDITGGGSGSPSGMGQGASSSGEGGIQDKLNKAGIFTDE